MFLLHGQWDVICFGGFLLFFIYMRNSTFLAKSLVSFDTRLPIYGLILSPCAEHYIPAARTTRVEIKQEFREPFP